MVPVWSICSDGMVRSIRINGSSGVWTCKNIEDDVEDPLELIQWCLDRLDIRMIWRIHSHSCSGVWICQNIGIVRSIHLNGSNVIWIIGMEQSIHDDPFKVMQLCLSMLEHWDGSEHPLELKQ
jgi:hypothetical protein